MASASGTAVGTVRFAIVVVKPRAASFCFSAAIDSGVTGVIAPPPRCPAAAGAAPAGVATGTDARIMSAD